MASKYDVGDWVMLSHNNHKEGIILYIGTVSGKNGKQYGIELTDFTTGKHNGTFQGYCYFETKDKKTNRGIFVEQNTIKRKLKKSDYRNPSRLKTRKDIINKLSFSDKLNIHFDPITSYSTIEIINHLGKWWLRYICLLLPTLDKFVLPRVCKTFHLFITLEIGREDTPDPPPFIDSIYKQFAGMDLLIEEMPKTEHVALRNSITDETDNVDNTTTPPPMTPVTPATPITAITPTAPITTKTNKKNSKKKGKKSNNTKNAKNKKKTSKNKKKNLAPVIGRQRSDAKLSKSSGNKFKKTKLKNSLKPIDVKKKRKRHKKSKSATPNPIATKQKNKKKDKHNKTMTPVTAASVANGWGTPVTPMTPVTPNGSLIVTQPSPTPPSVILASQSMGTIDENAEQKADYQLTSRGLNDEEKFLWEQLCKTEAMVQYVDGNIKDNTNNGSYEARNNIFDKIKQTIKQIYIAIDGAGTGSNNFFNANDNDKKVKYYKDGTGMLINSSLVGGNDDILSKLSSYKILDGQQKYNHILWIFACDFGEERQALDLETRRLIQHADYYSFNEYIILNKLYNENNGKLNLFNRRFLRRTPFERNIISYFLTFQSKLINIYNGNAGVANNNNNDNNDDDDAYSDENDFYLTISNLLSLDISRNSSLPVDVKILNPLNQRIFRKKNKLNNQYYINSFSFNNIGSLFLNPILSSSYNQLLSLELSDSNLYDNDLHLMCNAWKLRDTHSPLQSLSLSSNPGISDAYMDELFDVISTYLGNVMCLMLNDTSITDETCATILNFYKSQFSKSNIRNDKITKNINEQYNDIFIFRKELQNIRKNGVLNWNHSNNDIREFMMNIADEYGLLHEHYPNNNPNAAADDAIWSKYYRHVLKSHSFVLTIDSVIELFERKILLAELSFEEQLLSTPATKKRSKLKQIRLHLNAGITKMGFITLNDIFRKNYVHKKDDKTAILIDGYIDDFTATQDYKNWLIECMNDKEEYDDVVFQIKTLEKQIKKITQLLNNKNIDKHARVSYSNNRKKLDKEKGILIGKRMDLYNKIRNSQKKPLTDPKRDSKWDKRLMTDWAQVWTKWVDVDVKKNFI